MPTARGWLTAAAGATLILCGRAFGSTALEQVGFAFLFLVGIAVGLVRLRHHDLRVTRSLTPLRARAGQAVKVTLTLENAGRGNAPLVLLDERLPPELHSRARFAIGGLERGGVRDTIYVIKPPRRGRYEIGPLRLEFIDPFGMARRRGDLSGASSLLVHPRTERLDLPKDRGSRRSMSSSALRQLTGARGEDFYTLREYVQGDDLRKIHWPSTAKRSKPMIRQEETPWQNRATILLDDRAEAYGGSASSPAFERAVEAAASAADLCRRASLVFRFLTSGDAGLPPGRGQDHLHHCLDLLAVVDPDPALEAGALLRRLSEMEAATAPEGTLIFVCGDLSLAAAGAVGMCTRRFKQIVVVTFPTHLFDRRATGKLEISSEAVARLRAAGIRTLAVGPGARLGAAWAAMSGGGERGWDRRREPV